MAVLPLGEKAFQDCSVPLLEKWTISTLSKTHNRKAATLLSVT